MHSSNRRALMLAAALLGTSSGLPAMPVSRTVSLTSTGTSRAPRRYYGPPVPFSSDRQHQRAYRQYNKLMPNGHVVMQTRGTA